MALAAALLYGALGVTDIELLLPPALFADGLRLPTRALAAARTRDAELAHLAVMPFLALADEEVEQLVDAGVLKRNIEAYVFGARDVARRLTHTAVCSTGRLQALALAAGHTCTTL